MNYQSVFTVTPAAGTSAPWQFAATLLPHPVNFMFLTKNDGGGTSVENFMNTQLPGISAFNKMQNFWAYAQRYRMTYCSVTVYQDGPDLANQGVLAVCQTAMEPSEYNPCYLSSGGRLMTMAHVHQYSVTDTPNFAVAQTMPNAYLNNSRFGAYVPLKLTRTHQHWLTARDSASTSQVLAASEGSGATYELPTGAAYGVFPHVNVSPAFYNGGSGGAEPLSHMMNGMVAHICARNVAPTTSFTFFVRMGIEIQASPGTTYSPQLRQSPDPDPLAIESYFKIARQLKDAYPADYNDLGKIWDVISSIAKTVAPVLTAFGPIGAAVGAGISGAAGVGDRIKEAVTQRAARALEGGNSSKAVGSAGDRALAQAVVSAGSTSTTSRAKKARKKIARSGRKAK